MNELHKNLAAAAIVIASLALVLALMPGASDADAAQALDLSLQDAILQARLEANE